MPNFRGVVKTSLQPDMSSGFVTRVSAEHLSLAASITLANPTNAMAGDRLLLIVSQTGSGGFTINYGSAFATSAQPATTGTTAIEYYFDGKQWWLLYSH